MKVWFVNQFAIPPDRSGGTRHWSLARRLLGRGIQVEIIASAHHYLSGEDMEPGRRVYDGVPFTLLQPAPLPFLRGKLRRLSAMFGFARALRRYARENGSPDLVVGSTPSLPAAAAAAGIARRLEVSFILEVRDVWPQTLIDIGGYAPWHPGVVLLGWLEKRVYRAADHVITLLPHAGPHIEARGGAGTPITWIPNGVDLEGLLRDPATTAPPAPDGSAPFLVTYAGAHGAANALDAVLAAAALLREDADPPVRFRFIGAGERKEALRRRAEEEGMSNVEFLPPVSKREIYAHLRASDALIVNMNQGALYRFGISFNKLYDYFAAARPVVFGTDSANDPVAESGAGLSVPANDAAALADAVRRLSRMPASERRALGERGRTFVEREHDMAVLADRLAAVLEGTVAAGGGGAA